MWLHAVLINPTCILKLSLAKSTRLTSLENKFLCPSKNREQLSLPPYAIFKEFLCPFSGVVAADYSNKGANYYQLEWHFVLCGHGLTSSWTKELWFHRFFKGMEDYVFALYNAICFFWHHVAFCLSTESRSTLFMKMCCWSSCLTEKKNEYQKTYICDFKKVGPTFPNLVPSRYC